MSKPALRDSLPGARALAPALRALRPVLRETADPIRDQLRPFTRQVFTPVKHLRKATQMDAGYGEAFYVLGLIYNRTGHENLARAAFEKAQTEELPGAPKPAARRQPNRVSTIAPLFRMPTSHNRKMMTFGDERLARVLRQDALNAFNSSDVESN